MKAMTLKTGQMAVFEGNNAPVCKNNAYWPVELK
jgi:hypothetical protein